jgi:hypothetical protein
MSDTNGTAGVADGRWLDDSEGISALLMTVGGVLTGAAGGTVLGVDVTLGGAADASDERIAEVRSGVGEGVEEGAAEEIDAGTAAITVAALRRDPELNNSRSTAGMTSWLPAYSATHIGRGESIDADDFGASMATVTIIESCGGIVLTSSRLVSSFLNGIGTTTLTPPAVVNSASSRETVVSDWFTM